MARKDITMTDAEILEFLRGGSHLQVATIEKTGWPHVAPMWFVVHNDKAVFRSFTKSQKIVNLARDARLTVLLEDGDRYAELRGAMIKGKGTLVTDRDYVLEIYGELAAKYPMVGDDPVRLEGDALEAAFGRFAEKNTAVIVEPEDIISWDHRKIGGGY
ncbi:MAG: pyridoxamine 5'-phosphate oxidase [Acidimicrobiia bacterium]|nr:pyridoxamine 5'-phosphate oxidase [Acidimicrobiia bacterium]